MPKYAKLLHFEAKYSGVSTIIIFDSASIQPLILLDLFKDAPNKSQTWLEEGTIKKAADFTTCGF